MTEKLPKKIGRNKLYLVIALLHLQTYSVDKQIADSASTATAVLTGVKTGDYMLGVTGAVTKGNCSSSLPKERSVPTVFEDAFKHGELRCFPCLSVFKRVHVQYYSLIFVDSTEVGKKSTSL